MLTSLCGLIIGGGFIHVYVDLYMSMLTLFVAEIGKFLKNTHHSQCITSPLFEAILLLG